MMVPHAACICYQFLWNRGPQNLVASDNSKRHLTVRHSRRAALPAASGLRSLTWIQAWCPSGCWRTCLRGGSSHGLQGSRLLAAGLRLSSQVAWASSQHGSLLPQSKGPKTEPGGSCGSFMIQACRVISVIPAVSSWWHRSAWTSGGWTVQESKSQEVSVSLRPSWKLTTILSRRRIGEAASSTFRDRLEYDCGVKLNLNSQV